MCENKSYRGMCLFDLDGTLLNNKTNVIPESAQEAVRRLKAAGYVVVLSTGRDMDTHYSAAYKEIVRPDAIIHHNGTKITVGSELLFLHYMDHGLLKEIYDFCAANDMCIGTSIGSEDFFIHPELKAKSDRVYNRYIKRNFVPFEEIFKRNINVSALSFAGDVLKQAPLFETRFPDLKVMPFNSNTGGDVVENGFSKAEGMMKLCGYYGVTKEHTYAFGDSPNDIALLKAAAVGVAVGGADEAVKAVADMVTDDIDDNGIFNACVRLGLIEG